MTKVNGKVIHSPGIGRSTTGHSITVVKTSTAILRWLHQLILQFDNQLSEICQAFDLDQNDALFGVRFGDVRLEVIEKRSGTILLTFPDLFSFTG